MNAFEKEPRNQVVRVPNRGHYDKETIYKILDEALICHVGFASENQPFVIPTIHARDGDKILLHGATTSRLLKHVEAGHPLCITVTHVDGLVLARSVFHHSMNYRSAVVFGKGKLLAAEEKWDALERFTEKLIPGRWDDARQPTKQELKATTIVAVDIESASAKVRTGAPKDDEEDYGLDVWAGVVPMTVTFQAAEADAELKAGVELPDYLQNFESN